MNERIQQLAKQAGMTDDKFGMFFANDKHNEDGVDLQKFAELIVQECLHMADEFELDVNRSGLVDRMKEHFGLDNKSHSK